MLVARSINMPERVRDMEGLLVTRKLGSRVLPDRPDPINLMQFIRADETIIDSIEEVDRAVAETIQ
jgi:hypothetical protein